MVYATESLSLYLDLLCIYQPVTTRLFKTLSVVLAVVLLLIVRLYRLNWFTPVFDFYHNSAYTLCLSTLWRIDRLQNNSWWASVICLTRYNWFVAEGLCWLVVTHHRMQKYKHNLAITFARLVSVRCDCIPFYCYDPSARRYHFDYLMFSQMTPQ